MEDFFFLMIRRPPRSTLFPLHDALPISFMLQLDRGEAMRFLAQKLDGMGFAWAYRTVDTQCFGLPQRRQDRKSTRLNSSHANISYAVFCLKKNPHQLYIPANISAASSDY